MKTYWVDFIDTYESRLYSFSLLIILEAFWCFCNNQSSECEQMLTQKI